MKFYYSSSTKGFYNTSVNSSIPDDAVEISADHHQELLRGQASGLEIRLGASGLPEAVKSSGPTEAELKARCKATAKALLARTDWAVLPDVGLTAASRTAVVKYRKAVRELVVNPVAKPEWPEAPTTDWEA